MAKQKPHKCHQHIASAPFILKRDAEGNVEVIAMQLICCHCGALTLGLQGIHDLAPAGCGDYVRYQQVSEEQVDQARRAQAAQRSSGPRLLLADGPLPIQRGGHG
jgi:hypothetical protein